MASELIRKLFSPRMIRERCSQLHHLGLEDRLRHFRIRNDRLDHAVELVHQETLKHYPDLQVPPHSRWRHFVVEGVDHWSPLKSQIQDPFDRLQAQFDLVVTSVLLDAGAGPQWRFQDPLTGKRHSRSEGLALASLYLFAEGAFSSDPEVPLRADAQGLQGFTAEKLARGFQVSADNPLVGLEERAQLLRQLGKRLEVLLGWPEAPNPRIGGILDRLPVRGGRRLSAEDLLRTLLEVLQEVWPSRLTLGHQNLGDVWRHSLLSGPEITAELVPFHKLTQWLTYSLMEPLEESGVQLEGVSDLTGLPEYRNGGLFLDSGVLELKDPADAERVHPVSSELVVEWRALTIILLDQLADRLRQRLNRSADTLPLAQILQGGTWSAGRVLAYERRPDGSPPLRIQSDGTVF
jgi:hypothetical protein